MILLLKLKSSCLTFLLNGNGAPNPDKTSVTKVSFLCMLSVSGASET